MHEFEPPDKAGKIGGKRDNTFVARRAEIVHIRIDVCYIVTCLCVLPEKFFVRAFALRGGGP